MCIAISTIKAKDGSTPLKVVRTLLFFAEGNSRIQGEKLLEQKYDDTHYSTVLMYALSATRLTKATKNIDKWLKRITDIAETYFETLRTECANTAAADFAVTKSNPDNEKIDMGKKYVAGGNVITISFSLFVSYF